MAYKLTTFWVKIADTINAAMLDIVLPIDSVIKRRFGFSKKRCSLCKAARSESGGCKSLVPDFSLTASEFKEKKATSVPEKKAEQKRRIINIPIRSMWYKKASMALAPFALMTRECCPSLSSLEYSVKLILRQAFHIGKMAGKTKWLRSAERAMLT
ncbi:MAG: hypothetical protein HGB19_06445 [Chlorobiales bacterium]|nr:hypothetical protein [Chlorobiales bacterium]